MKYQKQNFAAQILRPVTRVDKFLIITLCLFCFTAGCAHLPWSREARPGDTCYGVASWYGGDFHGRKTANGERYDMFERTAAHRTLPFGTKVRVTNLRNGKRTIVRINDRGPWVRGRDIDLSYRAAYDIGMIQTGVEKVLIEVLP